MSDWEIGYLAAELNSGRYFRQGLAPAKIVTVGVEKTPVTTMGGLKIMPDLTVDECSMKSVDALILPGGNTWTDAIHVPILKMAEMLEFSVHVLKALDVCSPKTVDAWYRLNKTHEPQHFYELMNSIQ